MLPSPRPELVRRLHDAGFRWSDHIVLAFLAGSHQHGARLEGTSDLDIAGVFIEPPACVLGLDREEHFTHGTSDNSHRNTSKDVDMKLYSLRYWASLASKGNPAVLSFLFTPSSLTDVVSDDSVWATHILTNRRLFLARAHVAAFIGYGRAQLQRMQGVRGLGAHGQRKELVAKVGYDAKAAMHMIRLMHEAIELLQTGQLTYPRPEVAELLDIRRGRWPQTHVERHYLRLEAQLQTAEVRSGLPRAIDRDAVSRVIVGAYLDHWRRRNMLL